MEATGFQYIGELCRYLLGVPPRSDWETTHQVRFCVGNGLRPDIWEAFQERFGIPHITEFYGATESERVDAEPRQPSPEAIGKPDARHEGSALVRYDTLQEDEHVRDGRRLAAVAARDDEPGELLGTHQRRAVPRRAASRATRTRGRHREEDPARRLRVGRRLVPHRRPAAPRRADGFYYFVDRLGDTFRWKGENVSTQEVAQAVDAFPGRRALGGLRRRSARSCDGRAGMAGLVLEPGRLRRAGPSSST